MSATFSTPLDRVMAMYWDDVILWWAEARDIDGERWAPLRRLVELGEADR